MKRMALIFALAAVAILLVSCAEPQPAGIPAELRAIMEANRAIALPPLHPDFESLIDSILTPDFNPETAARIAEVLRRQAIISPPHPGRFVTNPHPLHPSMRISHALLAEEIHYFFDLLRYLYVGYQYFGGDEVFLPVRDSMLERLAETGDPLPVQSYLIQILLPPLRAVISDNHFAVHGGRVFFAPRHGLYRCDAITLRRDGGAFVAEIDGAAYKVIETTLRCGRVVDGVAPTITREGEFAFMFGHFARVGDPGAREMEALLESAATGERRSISMELRLLSTPHPPPSSLPAGALVAGREVGGVWVVENRRLFTFQGGFPYGDSFYQAGREARGRPVVVIDIRGHGGGYIDAALPFLYALAGRAPSSGAAFMAFTRDFPSELAGLQPAPEPRQPGDLPLGWRSPIPFSASETIPNDTFVIVLTNNRVSSAGDLLVGYLRQLENVLFVGTNTHGNVIGGGMTDETYTRLPHSGLTVEFGSWLRLRPDLSQFEGVGFLPDLWVPPGEALERALAFVERYGLNR